MPLIKAKQLQDVLSTSGSLYFSGTLSGPNWRISSSSFSGSFEGDGSGLTDLQITSVPTSSYVSPTFISSSMSEAGFGDLRRSDLNEYATTASLDLVSSSLSTQIASLTQDTGSYIRTNQTSSLSVATASYISPTFISASAAASGFSSVTDYVSTSSFNTYTGSLNLKTSSLESSIVSLNTKTSSLESSILALNSSTSSFLLVNQTSSMSVSTASYISPAFISSSMSEAGFSSTWALSTSSFNVFTSSVNTRLNSIELTTSSLNSKTGSIDLVLSSLNSYTSSADSRMFDIESSTSSLNTKTGSLESSISNLNTKSASYDTSISSLITKTGSIDVSIGALNTKTGSTDIRLNSIELATGSLNVYTGSIDISISSLNSQTSSYVLNSQTSSMSVATSSFSFFANDVVESKDFIIEKEHFTGGATVSSKTNAWWFPSGNGTVSAFQKTNFIGGVNLQTGTGGTGQQVMYVGASGGSYTFTGIVFRSSSVSVQFKSLVSPISIPTGSGENTGMLIGFADSAATGTLTNGFRFEYFFSGSGVTWFCRTASSSLSTLINTGVTVSTGSDYYLYARVQGTTASFYINSSLVATSSTNIPTNVYLSPLLSARITGYRGGAGGNHQLGIDYFDYKIQYPTVTQNLNWDL